MNNPSDKPEDTADTVTNENEPKEVTFSVNDIFNSFDELGKKIKQYERKKGGSIMEEGFQNDQSC